ncbi:MAG: GFA family protein, partial [Chitinophagales bacterium]|nr:GFA family protein [Hyphomicrobiales bacterium]
MTLVRASGRCLCGSVNYEICGPLRDIVLCHCTLCQRLTGSFFAATQCRTTEMVLIHHDRLAWFQSSPDAERGFCSICGSTMFWRRKTDNLTCIAAGTLNPPTRLKTAMHIFTADKSDWCEILDACPQFPGSAGAALDTVRWS